jgi:hypothetical protein
MRGFLTFLTLSLSKGEGRRPVLSTQNAGVERPSTDYALEDLSHSGLRLGEAGLEFRKIPGAGSADQ